MEAEDELQAVEMARRAVELLLPDKDSLKGIAQLKKDQMRIKNNLDGQIVRILQSKVDEADDWVSILKQSVDHVQKIETSFATIETECEMCNQRVQQWQTIKTFNQARTNVNSALAELQLLRSLPDELEEVREMMDDDEARDETLLDVHSRLIKLEETRARVISKHRRREVDLPDTHRLVKSFEMVSDLVHGFEEITCDHLTHAIDLAQEAPEILVRILRVIERQERIDRWWRQDATKERKTLADMQAKGIGPAEMGGQLGYTPLGWREKAMVWMQTGVENRFHDMISTLYEKEGDVSPETISSMTELRDELIVLFDDVAPCFPPAYDAFALYVQHYHLKLKQTFDLLLEKAAEGHLPAGQSLNLVNWINEYRELLQSLGIPEPPPGLVSLTTFETGLLESHERMFAQNIDTLATRILDDDWR